jgi:hypothetical protein
MIGPCSRYITFEMKSARTLRVADRTGDTPCRGGRPGPQPTHFRLDGKDRTDCNRAQSTPVADSETLSARGAWPVASRNFSNPAREIEVVIVFTRG